MPKKESAGAPESSLWQAESLRLTSFLTPATKADPGNWWSGATGGGTYESSATQPKTGKEEYVGQHKNGRLALTILPNRIDWLFSPTSDEDKAESGTPPRAPFDALLIEFREVVDRWLALQSCPKMQRLAFGAVLAQPVEDRQKGYVKLKEYLEKTVVLDAKGSSDFTYQINRPRKSGVDGATEINRLSNWSVGIYFMTRVSLTPMPSTIHKGPESFACRLILDINTSADYKGEIAREKTGSMFHELVEAGKDIAQRGDAT